MGPKGAGLHQIPGQWFISSDKPAIGLSPRSLGHDAANLLSLHAVSKEGSRIKRRRWKVDKD
jgi:hypothetical protein